ncbi:MAG TPA: DoxX family protein [Intrasporangium sp.]|jgi:thiosulfate dehydrogenase (quinone) large subunit|uniref:DoxX family protein n=1 Tax=Intrasporangium sp. TaxID=1925024 RepID=UPI002F954B80
MATIHHSDVSRVHDVDTKHPADGIVTFEEEIVRSAWARRFLAVLRIVMGWTFMWAFVDKLFGLGYATPSARAWINGGTPAQGFMKAGAESDNPFAQFFANIAGPWSDWLFMIGLFGIGIALLTGAGLKIAAWTGTALLLFMYLAQLPWYATEGATNPITDSHWIEALAIIVVAATYAGDTWGIGKWWGRIVGNGILR